MGWMFSDNAYRPILITQAQEIKYLKDDRIRLLKSFRYLIIEGEAHRQDMKAFEKRSSVVAVLRRLGVYGQFAIKRGKDRG